MSDSAEDGDTYEVEKILKFRRLKGVEQYYIKWKGYDHDENCWVGVDDIFCPELVDEYWAEEHRKEKEKAAAADNKRRKSSERQSISRKKVELDTTVEHASPQLVEEPSPRKETREPKTPKASKAAKEAKALKESPKKKDTAKEVVSIKSPIETRSADLEPKETDPVLDRILSTNNSISSMPKFKKMEPPKQPSPKKSNLEEYLQTDVTASEEAKSSSKFIPEAKLSSQLLSLHSWDADISKVITIIPDPEEPGKTRVYVGWVDGTKTFHSTKTANAKFPQKMLAFYEKHLKFS